MAEKKSKLVENKTKPTNASVEECIKAIQDEQTGRYRSQGVERND